MITPYPNQNPSPPPTERRIKCTWLHGHRQCRATITTWPDIYDRRPLPTYRSRLRYRPRYLIPGIFPAYHDLCTRYASRGDGRARPLVFRDGGNLRSTLGRGFMGRHMLRLGVLGGMAPLLAMLAGRGRGSIAGINMARSGDTSVD